MWSFQYSSISATGTLNVAKGPATLIGITINTGAASAVLTVYDNTAGSGTKIATIDATTRGSLNYFCRCKTGITVVLSGGNADVTVIYS